MNKEHQDYFLKKFPEISFKNEPLKNHSTFGIGGNAKIFILPKNEKELAEILKYIRDKNLNVFFTGSGSNLLYSDEGYNGVIISLKNAFKNLSISDDGIIKSGAGVILVKMVTKAIKKNIQGLESLAGGTGTLGGALFMNAGAYGSEISNFFVSAKFLDYNGNIKIIKSSDVSFSYRKSNFPTNYILIEATFKCDVGKKESILKNKNKFSQSRKTSQPLQYRSAGSIFKNPPGDYAAGYLIDKAGLKGTKKGNAMISDKHANFIVNIGNASAKDIIYLIGKAKKEVLKKFNINLELEIKLVGFNKIIFEKMNNG